MQPDIDSLFQKLWHGADYNYEQWLHMPQIHDDDFRLMKLAHVNIVSIGIFSWVMLEPEDGQYTFDWLDRLMDRLAENDIKAVLATPSAGTPAWLARKYPEVLRMDEKGVRNPHRGRQNFCFSSPIYREKVNAINSRLAERYKDHPALLLWHVSNEYAGTKCHCDLCYNAFHDWLKNRYGDLESLNLAWWATFWSHRYTDWDLIEPVDKSVPSLMLDWQRFTSDHALDFYIKETEPLREIAPQVPVMTNFMRPDVGLDYWKFAEHIDIICWDAYPYWHQRDDTISGMEFAFYHDLHRSFGKGEPFLLLESTPSQTNWQGISRLKKPGMHKLSSLQAVAHGSNSVMYFQWRQGRGSSEKFHGTVVSNLNSEHTRVFKDVAEVGAALEQLSDLIPTRIHADVAIIYDFDVEWALKLAEIPGRPNVNYQVTCQQHYNAFWKSGIAADIINSTHDFEGYKLLVAPMLYMLLPGVAERIEAFVQAGGIFVTTYVSGLVNESDLFFLEGYPPALRRTLGIYSEEFDSLAEHQRGEIKPTEGNPMKFAESYAFYHFAELVHAESAEVLATYASEFYAGYPALTVNTHGEGQAYYIAARTDDTFLADFYAGVCKQIDVNNGLPFKLPPGVSMTRRDSDAQGFLFLMNFTEQEQRVEIGDDVYDALSGESVNSSIALPPYGIEILKQFK